MNIDSEIYQKAFENYVRKGIPIALSLKQARPTTHYIWRTRLDSKVRSSHAINDGRIFSWGNPPATGHPGEDYNCRCRAIPYEPGISEHLELKFTNVNDAPREWTSADFVNHYKSGNGESVRLRQTGHLIKVVGKYREIVEDRLKNQIADAARNNAGSSFFYNFGRPYDMTDLVFSLGDTVIGGFVFGKSTATFDYLNIEGTLSFYLRDAFADPIDAGIELPGHAPYPVRDDWGGRIFGQVLANNQRSQYRWP